MRILPAIFLTIPLIAAACAEPRGAETATAEAAVEARDCFWPNAVTGFSGAGQDQVRIHAGGDEYLFEMFGNCPVLDLAENIALRSRGGGMVCRGIDAELVVPFLDRSATLPCSDDPQCRGVSAGRGRPLRLRSDILTPRRYI